VSYTQDKNHSNRNYNRPYRHPPHRGSHTIFIIPIIIIIIITITTITPTLPTLRLHILLEKPIIIPHHVPRGIIFADNIPPLRPIAIIVVLFGIISTINSGAAHVPGSLPDQLREVARGLGVAGRLAEVVHTALVGPGGDGGRGVGVAAGEVFAVGAVLASRRFSKLDLVYFRRK